MWECMFVWSNSLSLDCVAQAVPASSPGQLEFRDVPLHRETTYSPSFHAPIDSQVVLLLRTVNNTPVNKCPAPLFPEAGSLVAQAGFQLLFLLPLPPTCGNAGIPGHYAQPSSLIWVGEKDKTVSIQFPKPFRVFQRM